MKEWGGGGFQTKYPHTFHLPSPGSIAIVLTLWSNIEGHTTSMQTQSGSGERRWQKTDCKRSFCCPKIWYFINNKRPLASHTDWTPLTRWPHVWRNGLFGMVPRIRPYRTCFVVNMRDYAKTPLADSRCIYSGLFHPLSFSNMSSTHPN